ncbi:MAG: class I SAM-dependent methyltransferase [Pseudomonadota bacterium]
MEDGGWTDSAPAWIASQGDQGDKSRRYILDRAMLDRIDGHRFKRALDVGCGEGRFCRMLRERGIDPTGIDPTAPLIACAQERDPGGDYRLGRAEALDLSDASFDLVVAYLSLIDIPDFRAAISEMVRVLEPGGTLLVANLTSFSTAGTEIGWQYDAAGSKSIFGLDGYMTEGPMETAWAGLRITNWHRPLSAYMQAYLSHGLTLVHFDEPTPHSPDGAAIMPDYPRAPWFNIMQWQKPA